MFYSKTYSKPSDKAVTNASRLITLDSTLRTLLQENLYVESFVKLGERVDPSAVSRPTLINAILPNVIKVDAIYSKLKKEKRVATAEEQREIDYVEAMREIIIQVDSFARLGQELNYDSTWTKELRPAYTSKAASLTNATATATA